MASVVSFDYFPPFEYVDVGFSEVIGWNPHFEWVGYDSVNFLIGLGSIAIFAALQIAIILIAIFIVSTRIRCPCKWGRKKFKSDNVRGTTIAFIHGTCFEILVSCSVSNLMLEKYSDWEVPDKVSIISGLVFYAFLAVYLLFGIYFVCFKTSDLALKKRAKQEARNI